MGVGIGWDVSGLMSGDSEGSVLMWVFVLVVDAWSYIFD